MDETTTPDERGVNSDRGEMADAAVATSQVRGRFTGSAYDVRMTNDETSGDRHAQLLAVAAMLHVNAACVAPVAEVDVDASVTAVTAATASTTVTTATAATAATVVTAATVDSAGDAVGIGSAAVAASASASGPLDARALIADRLPWMVEQIRIDAAGGRLSRWGLSTVIDEHAGVPVLDRTTFEALHSVAGLGESDGIAWPIGNAGLLHVYGYLLSEVPTPWGAKRDRWVSGDVARVFGEDPTYLTPWYGMGDGVGPAPVTAGSIAGRTMLAHVERVVTSALTMSARARVVFVRDERIDPLVGLAAGSTAAPAGGAGGAAAAAAAAALPSPAAAAAAREGTPVDAMRTVVVVRDDMASAALAYGRVSFDGAGRLVGVRPVTVFPIALPDATALDALASADSRLRYNAAFPDLPPRTSLPLSSRPVP